MEDITETERAFKRDIREIMNFAIAMLIPLVVCTVFKISVSCTATNSLESKKFFI